MELSRWRLKGNNFSFMTDLQFFQCLCILFGLFNLSVCLFEDQIGKFDWKQNYVGKLKFSHFDTVSTAKRIIVATEENVLAALNLKTGQIIWRQVLERANRSQIEFLHVDSEIVTVSTDAPSGPYLVRGWEPISGILLWEWSFVLSRFELRLSRIDWLISQGRLIHILLRPPPEDHKEIGLNFEVTSYNLRTGHNKGETTKVSAKWIDNPKRCVLATPYFACITGGKIMTINLAINNSLLNSLPLTMLSDNVDNVVMNAISGPIPSISIQNEHFFKIITFSDKGLFEVPSIQRSSSELIIPYGELHCILQLTHISAEELEISGSLIGDEGVMEEFRNRLPYPTNLGQAHISAGFCSVRNEKATVCRFVIGTEDEAIVLIQNAARIVWVREESLAHIVAVDMLDLPVSDLDASIETEFDNKGNTDLFDMVVRRISSQLSQMRSLVLTVLGLAAPPSKNEAAGLVRDEFGLHKMIVAATAAGKLFGIDNRNGEIRWQQKLENISPFNAVGKIQMQLLVQRTTRHFPHPAQCALVAKDKITGEGVLFTFNPITGAPIDRGVERLGYHIKQLLLLPDGDAESLRGIIFLDKQNKIHVTPNSAHRVLLDSISQIYLFTTESDGTLTGYTLSNSKPQNLIATPTWQLKLHSRHQQIIDIIAKNPLERVHSQGRVLADRSVLFKYVNPNLVAIATQAQDPIHKQIITIYLIDVVSGSVIFSVSHKRARGPVHVVHSENWLAYSYFNDKWRRTEIATLELYEGKEQSNSTAFSSLAAPPLPIVERQAYIMPANILIMKETITEKGITSKHVLMALSNGAILEMPWMFLDPRRPIATLPEEGVVPYMPELPVPSEAMLNYNQSVMCPRGIHTVPSGLESTSLVFVHGLDIFYTRVAPSKTFDVLKEDFDYYLITIVLVGLTAASYITRQLASRKALKQAWK